MAEPKLLVCADGGERSQTGPDVIDWASDKDTGFTLWHLNDALKRLASIDRDSFELDTDSYQQLQRWAANTLQNLP